jgi:Indigoidine synthase A like protein
MPPLSRGFQRLRVARNLNVSRFQVFKRFQSTQRLGSRNDFFKISEEVQEALETGRPVVALETTIYTHG